MRRTALLAAAALGGLLAAQTAVAQQYSTPAAPSTDSRASSSGGVSASPTDSNRAATKEIVGAMEAKDFADKLAIANMFEIESSKLALNHSKNENVKSFARNMIQEHTDAANKLKAAAARSHKTADLAKELDPEHARQLETLRTAAATVFDREYIQAQVKGHEEAATLLKEYSAKGDNSDLKQIAVQMLPIVEQHLDHAKRLQNPASASR